MVAKASGSKKWLILAVLVAIPFMVTMDGTVVNVALPVMAKDIGVSLESIQTVVSCYLVAVVGSILLFGRLGDMLGKGRMFTLGVVVFGLGSLVAALSRQLWLLDVARVVQGIGGAAAMANNQGIITEVFPENERGRALGISGVFAALGTTLGPPIGGLIVTKLHWSYIFLINVPVALLAFVAGLALLPKGQKKSQKLDLLGAGVMAAGVVLFFVVLFQGEKIGFAKPLTLLGLALSVGLLVLFVLLEKRSAQPLLDLSLFKNPMFTISVFCVLILFVVSGGVSILMPVYLEDLRQFSAAQSGLILMALPIAMGLLSPVSGTLSDKIGPAPLTVAGLGVLLLGTGCLAFATGGTPLWGLIAFLVLIGIGSGLFAAPNTSLIMGTAPKDKLGIAGSINGFMRNCGSAVGVSLFSSIQYAVMSAIDGRPVTGYVPGKPQLFLSAWKTVFLFGVVLLAVGLTLTVVRLMKQKKEQVVQEKQI